MRPTARGLTLLEIVVASALTAVVVGALAGGLFATQRSVRYGLSEEAGAGVALRIAGQVGDELRDLNVHTQDLEPDPAALRAFHPTAADPLRYRCVSGFDAGEGAITVSPTRASGSFRQLYLAGGQLVLITPRAGVPVVLASEVSDLELDLDQGATPARLRIRVSSSRPHPDDPERRVGTTAELVVSLANAQEAAQ